MPTSFNIGENMKTRREKVILHLLALAVLPALCGTGYAEPVSVATARRVAVNHMNKLKCSKQELIHHETEASIAYTGTSKETDVYHVINFEPEGWVIVSADDVAQPIIAYSETGWYSAVNHPPGFDVWMGNVRDEIYNAISSGMQPQDQAKQAWEKLDVPMEDFAMEEMLKSEALAAAGVAPLLKTTWGQGGL